MSSINKVTYTESKSDVVTLIEYALFNDDIKNEKTIILKLRNNVAQKLNNLKYEITEYDKSGLVVEKLTTELLDLNASGLEEFVPKYKIKINELCETISVKLLKATFEKAIYENDKFEKIPYTFDEARVKEEKIIEKQIIKEKKKKRKKGTFTNIDISKKNKVVFPKVMAGILITLGLVGLIIGIIAFRGVNKNVKFGDFEYSILSDNELEITKYVGKNENVVIPQEVKNKRIVSIASYAFNKSNIRTIYSEASVDVNTHAFEECSELKIVSGIYNVINTDAFYNCQSLIEVDAVASEVKSQAFKDCGSLTYVRLIADVETLAFYGSYNVETLEIGTTSSYSIGGLFNGTGELIYSLTSFKCQNKSYSEYFFRNVSKLTEISVLMDSINDKHLLYTNITTIYYI